MSEWNKISFADFVEINPAIKLKAGEEYSFVEMKDLDATQKFVSPSARRKLTSGSRFQNGDTLFARITPCLENGKICQVKNLENGVGFGSTEFLVLRGKEKVSTTDFVYYLSRWNNIRSFAVQNMIGTSGRQRVGKDAFKILELEFPDLKTQQRIASILSSLDDAIELNQQINKTLEEMAKAIFKEWFVDFNFPNATGKFQETEIGKIPVGWKVGKLGDVAEINPKLSLKKGTISKYVEMKDLSEDSAIIKNYREREFSSGSKFQNGDTLFARITPCLENGKTGLVSFLDENEIGWGSTEFIVLRGKENIGSNFIYCLSRFEPFRNHAVKSMLGSSGRQRVVESMLIEFALAIPPKELLIDFEKLVSPFFSQINNNEQENQSLSNLRDTLLPKLMKGEIKINL